MATKIDNIARRCVCCEAYCPEPSIGGVILRFNTSIFSYINSQSTPHTRALVSIDDRSYDFEQNAGFSTQRRAEFSNFLENSQDIVFSGSGGLSFSSSSTIDLATNGCGEPYTEASVTQTTDSSSAYIFDNTVSPPELRIEHSTVKRSPQTEDIDCGSYTLRDRYRGETETTQTDRTEYYEPNIVRHIPSRFGTKTSSFSNTLSWNMVHSAIDALDESEWTASNASNKELLYTEVVETGTTYRGVYNQDAPSRVSIRRAKFAFTIPDDFGGSYYKMSYKIVDNEGDTLSEGMAVWQGPGVAGDPESWQTELIDIPLPSDDGQVRVVPLRYKCSRSSPWHNF